MLKMQTLDKAKIVLNMVGEKKNVVVNQRKEIQSLKKLLEDDEVEKNVAKQKATKWEEKYNMANKSAREWADKHEKLRLADVATIQDLEKTIKVKFEFAEKWRAKVVISVECLKILHNISSEHLFNYEEWDTIYSSYEAKSPRTESSRRECRRASRQGGWGGDHLRKI